MKFLRKMILGAAATALLALPMLGRADVNTNSAPDFKEVYDLIRTHLAGETEADLNRDAVQGLLHQLHSKVSLVGSENAPTASTDAPVLAKSSLYDGPVAYLRVGRVGEGLVNKIVAAYKELDGTNHLKGLVLDLRFADGHDYAEAAAVADLFITKEKPLLDWGHGVVQSKAKTDAISLPVAVLVNQETVAAAEALAAMLREDDRAILLGSNTAGEATMSQEFPLKDGGYLRIATAAIKLGNGEMLSAKGVKPDIQVSVKPEDERAYYADPFKEMPSSMALIASILGESSVNSATNGTNRIAHPRQINEAELMRERKEKPGAELDGAPPPMTAREAEAEKPVIRDPVLGRALDLVKGISVIRRTHSS
ncbi:MAG: Peptidase [Pedosphaera sp.]|nr:Peptidase [Pedosphaera sp.]